ncbi:MAG TPA: hypothetical protein VJH34_00370 [archaeon]|nr:hypothetical protein [archaeon]
MKNKKARKGNRVKNLKRRIIEIFTLPMVIIGAVIFRVFLSFTGWIRAILLTVGVVDGFASNYFYKEEKFFPYQFLRYGRIVANFSGIINPIVPVVWNIGDGAYSLMMYKNQTKMENAPRYGRILNGVLQTAFY